MSRERLQHLRKNENSINLSIQSGKIPSTKGISAFLSFSFQLIFYFQSRWSISSLIYSNIHWMAKLNPRSRSTMSIIHSPPYLMIHSSIFLPEWMDRVDLHGTGPDLHLGQRSLLHQHLQVLQHFRLSFFENSKV